MTRRARVLLALAVVAAVASGCSDDEATPLSDDQLPSDVVSSATDDAGIPTTSSCEAVNRAQEKVMVTAAPHHGYRYWTYQLDDGSFVGVSVMQPTYPYEDPSAALALVSDAVAECADQDADGGVAALDDVPDGAVGFRSTTTDSNGTREGTTLLAPAGEDRIVTVTTSYDAGTEPSVDAAALLADARDRAGDLDLDLS
ncbi:hypothetical protein [Nocardioides sp. URHA0020]|uniref:hypothetical protein n=1 Tax=Nocardioides sp. URHA0020 TaxID=1380392 RepID=UPI00048F5DD3|nr:hypothetical protein [Nocardioides sp. URHA0020]